MENRRIQPLEDQIAPPFPLYRIGDGVDKLDAFFLAAFQKPVPERDPHAERRCHEIMMALIQPLGPEAHFSFAKRI